MAGSSSRAGGCSPSWPGSSCPRLAKREVIEQVASGLYDFGTGRLTPRNDAETPK